VNVPASHLRRFVIAITVIGCATANGTAARILDPASIAQIKSRTLGPRAEDGFAFPISAGFSRHAAAMPFAPPAGTADHVCNALIAPFEFLPQALLSSSTSMLPRADRQAASPTNWFEYIDVYPAGEAASTETRLRSLLGRCSHFQWAVPTATTVWMRTTVTSLPAIGDSTMYASIRTLPAQPGQPSLAWDWVLIRSGNTLVMLDDQGSSLPTATAPNTVMTQLVKDAWHRYSDR
jgi:hypothetical protein